MDNEKNREKNSEGNGDDAGEIRVTDRRRIHLNDNGGTGQNAGSEIPNLRPSYVEELEARTKAAENLVHEVQSRFTQLRTQLEREMDETRQRLNRAAEERAQREKADFITSLLPVLDNLQRATEAAETGSAPDVIIEGVRRTASSFANSLALAGVEPIESVGHPFNPELHEAIDTVAVQSEMEGQVIVEHARGYRMGNRLLRPAQVKVGRSPDKAREAAE